MPSHYRSSLARALAPVAVIATVVVTGLTAIASGAPSVTSGTTQLGTIRDNGTATTMPASWATSAHPKSLVVVFHGHGHSSEEWQDAGELRAMAGRDNAVVVAPGTTVTSAANGNGTFDTVDEEARGAAAAIKWARAAYHPTSTYLMCVSMGCTGLAYFLDSLARTGDADARFIQSRGVGPITGLVIAEGLSNLVETWGEANAADPTSAAEIEAETGGTPATVPAAYRSRSLALLDPHVFSRLHLAQVAVIHDVDDGLVPVNQGVETRAALAAAQVAYRGYTVVRDDATGCKPTHQTTGTSYAGKYFAQYAGSPVLSRKVDPTLCLAGHASEVDPSTPVMKKSFDVLHFMTNGGISPGEVPVDATPR